MTAPTTGDTVDSTRKLEQANATHYQDQTTIGHEVRRRKHAEAEVTRLRGALEGIAFPPLIVDRHESWVSPDWHPQAIAEAALTAEP